MPPREKSTESDEPDPEISPPQSFIGIAARKADSNPPFQAIMNHASEDSCIQPAVKPIECQDSCTLPSVKTNESHEVCSGINGKTGEHDSSDRNTVEVSPAQVFEGLLRDGDAEGQASNLESASSKASSGSSTPSSSCSSISDSDFADESLFSDASHLFGFLPRDWPMATIEEHETPMSTPPVSPQPSLGRSKRSSKMLTPMNDHRPLDVLDEPYTDLFYIDVAATRMQAAVRGRQAKRKYLSSRRAALKLQSWFRKCLHASIWEEIPSEGESLGLSVYCHALKPCEKAIVPLDGDNTIVSIDDEPLNTIVSLDGEYTVLSLDDDCLEAFFNGHLEKTSSDPVSYDALHDAIQAESTGLSIPSQGMHMMGLSTSSSQGMHRMFEAASYRSSATTVDNSRICPGCFGGQTADDIMPLSTAEGHPLFEEKSPTVKLGMNWVDLPNMADKKYAMQQMPAEWQGQQRIGSPRSGSPRRKIDSC